MESAPGAVAVKIVGMTTKALEYYINLVDKIVAEFEKIDSNFKEVLFWASLESACEAGDLGLILGLGRSPEEGNGNLLQYSCLRNPINREAWWSTVHRVTKSQTQLSD